MPSLGAVKAGEAFVEMFIRDKNVRKGLDRVKSRFAAAGKSIAGMMSAAAIGTTAVVAGLTAIVKAATSVGDKLHKMAIRTGFSATALSELYHAADLSGASLESLEKAVKRMAVVLLDAGRGLKDANDSLQDVGLSVDQLTGKKPEEQFFAIAEALAEIDDESRRAALAQKLFGRAGTELLPLIASGKEGLKEMREEARRLGLTWSQEDVEAAAKLNDAINTVKRQMVRFAAFLGTEMADSLVEYLKTVQEIIAATIKWSKENKTLSDSLLKGLDPFLGLKTAWDLMKRGASATRALRPRGAGGVAGSDPLAFLGLANALRLGTGAGAITGESRSASSPASLASLLGTNRTGSRLSGSDIARALFLGGAGGSLLGPGVLAGSSHVAGMNLMRGASGMRGLPGFGIMDAVARSVAGQFAQNMPAMRQSVSRAGLTLEEAGTSAGHAQRVAAMRQQADTSRKQLNAMEAMRTDIHKLLLSVANGSPIVAADLGAN